MFVLTIFSLPYVVSLSVWGSLETNLVSSSTSKFASESFSSTMAQRQQYWTKADR